MTDLSLFAGKVALVTGAGVGIGYEIARQLALHGAKVLLNDVDEALAGHSAAAISREGGLCSGIGGDISTMDTVQNLVDQAVCEFGRLDLLICNAGLTVWGDFFEYTPEMFERVIGVNLRGTYFLTQAAARQMRTQGDGGRVLLMSSVSGHQAIQYLSVYGMTKAALEMMARNLVIDLSPHGITINCIAPGATVTPRNLADDPNYETIWGKITPTGRVGTPGDIANAALFLLSPAASQITGQTLIVDGGWSLTSPTPRLDFVEK